MCSLIALFFTCDANACRCHHRAPSGFNRALMIPLSVLDLAPILQGQSVAQNVREYARSRAPRGALELQALLGRRASQHPEHRQRRDVRRYRLRRGRNENDPRRCGRNHAAQSRAAGDRRAVRHARDALSRDASTSVWDARPGPTRARRERCVATSATSTKRFRAT